MILKSIFTFKNNVVILEITQLVAGFLHSFFNSFMIPSISIILDEGSDTFIVARHKEVVGAVRALSHVNRPFFLNDERIKHYV